MQEMDKEVTVKLYFCALVWHSGIIFMNVSSACLQLWNESNSFLTGTQNSPLSLQCFDTVGWATGRASGL